MLKKRFCWALGQFVFSAQSFFLPDSCCHVLKKNPIEVPVQSARKIGTSEGTAGKNGWDESVRSP